MSDKRTKESRSREITLKIFRIILEESNGYSQQEINEKQLAEESEHSEYFEKIQKLIKSQI